MKFLFLSAIALAIVGCDAQRAEVEAKTKGLQEQAAGAVNEKVEQGKQAASKVVDEKLKEAKDEAAKAVSQKIDETKDSVVKGATKAVDDAKQQMQPGKAFSDLQRQSIAMAESVKSGKAFDPRVKEWIETTMANSSHAIQSLAIPSMQQAYTKFPEHRSWLEKQVTTAAKSSEGKMKESWDDILTNWQRIRALA